MAINLVSFIAVIMIEQQMILASAFEGVQNRIFFNTGTYKHDSNRLIEPQPKASHTSSDGHRTVL